MTDWLLAAHSKIISDSPDLVPSVGFDCDWFGAVGRPAERSLWKSQKVKPTTRNKEQIMKSNGFDTCQIPAIARHNSVHETDTDTPVDTLCYGIFC